jgi:hypothetical protein
MNHLDYAVIYFPTLAGCAITVLALVVVLVVCCLFAAFFTDIEIIEANDE